MTWDRAMSRRWGRWLATFVGFPLAGVTARVVAGNIDTVGAAALGGVAGGAALGAVQAAIGGLADRGGRWTMATAAGLGVGLTAGAAAVGYRTDPASLAMMGAVSGAAVGAAQASVLGGTRTDQVLWAVATPVLWAAGWMLTSQVIVDADRHHAIFGSSGALLVSAATALLHARRQPTDHAHAAIVASIGTEVAA